MDYTIERGTSADQALFNSEAATIKQVAEALQCGSKHIERLRSRKEIPFYRVGRRLVRYSIPDVLAALKATSTDGERGVNRTE